jgi:recombinational DNA repair protein RecR
VSRLPGIGPKGAERIARHVTSNEDGRRDARDIADALLDVADEHPLL